MAQQMEKYYSIGDVSSILGVSVGTIRNWENEFSSFITVRRDQHKMRFYTEDVLQRLKKIHELRNRGTSIPTIKELLERYIEQQESQEPAPTNTAEEQKALPVTQPADMPKPSPTLVALKEHIDEAIKVAVYNALEEQRLILNEQFQEEREALVQQITSQFHQEFDSLKATMEEHIKEQENLAKERNRKFDETVRTLLDNAKKEAEQQKRGFFAKLFGKE